MDRLAAHLPPNFCGRAAERLLTWGRDARERGTVLIASGFCVGGRPETDGPPGVVAVARALRGLGFGVTVVTDEYCRELFEAAGLDVVCVGAGDDDSACASLLDRLAPVGMISIERCGRNVLGDYANMRGASIAANTAPVDRLFELSEGRVPSIGVGDGGNEVGMGLLAAEISRELSIVPCRVRTDCLVVATVSNWGAYGLAAELEARTGLPLAASPDEIERFMRRSLELGCVDGVTGRSEMSVDGFPFDVELEVMDDLAALARRAGGE